jgi:phage baseplate assembly protein W
MNPFFGCNLKRFLFEGITEINIETLRENLISSISIFIPEITVTAIDITPDEDYNSINLSINYILNVSNAPDQVTIQLQ